MAGGTAPTTLAGLLVQALTESLFGIVLSQLRKPGAQVIIGGLLSNMDMQTTIYGLRLARNGAAQRCLYRHDQVAVRADVQTAGCSDAKMFDEQAVMEATINITTVALIGGNMIHDVGYIESGLTSSPDMLVASTRSSMRKRSCGASRWRRHQGAGRARRGRPRRPLSGHTTIRCKRFKTENLAADLLATGRFGTDWEASGSKALSAARPRADIEILEPDPEPLLDEKMYDELRRVCELAGRAGTKTKSWTVSMFV